MQGGCCVGVGVGGEVKWLGTFRGVRYCQSTVKYCTVSTSSSLNETTDATSLATEAHDEHHDAQVLSLSKVFNHHLGKTGADKIMGNENLVADLMKWGGSV